MIYPTRLAVLAAAAGAPVALLIAVQMADLWYVALAWPALVVAGVLVDAIAELKISTDRGSPGLDQLVAAKLIESGRFDRHLRRMRKLYAAKRDALVESLARHAPSVAVTGLTAGFHAVAHLPKGVGETEVVDAARERGVGLYGMSANRADKSVE